MTDIESTLNYVSKEGKEIIIEFLPSDNSLLINKILEKEFSWRILNYKITR